MRKLFFLIPAMLLSLAMSADPIGPNDPNVTVNNVIADAVAAASANAIIELSDGIYKEDGGFSIDKNITIQAAEGANPVIAQKYAFFIVNNAQVTFKGIKFDGGLYPAWGDNNDKHASDHCLRTYDASTGSETLTLDNCEFVNFPSYIIYAQRGNRRMDAITIRNCYFHDNLRSAVYVGYDSSKSTELACNSVTIENSTFANFTNVQEALISIKNNGVETDNIALRVDHCTFYNFVKNTSGDYSFIDCRKSTDVVISNCIFAQPDASMSKATYIYGGTINNCLTFNTSGHRSSSLAHNELSDKDPLFNDLATNKYTYAGEYGVSMSPARGAGTDGSDLGDPRWYTEVTYPSTDFASGYVLNGGIAELTGNIEYNTLKSENEADHYLRYYDRSVNGTAIWKIHATRSCYVQATLNMFDNSWNYAEDPAERKSYKNGGHIFAVQLLDMNSNPIDGSVAVAEPSESDAIGDILVPGSIFIPAEGDYIIQLSNSRGYSKCGISSVTLTYTGGDFVTIPSADPIPFADAILSEKATRSLSPAEIHFGSPNAAQYAQWNAHASAGLYDITFTFTGTNHGIYQLIIKQGNNTIFSDTKGQGGSGSVSFESVMIPADGDYVIQVANINPGADGYLTSVTAAAAALADAWIIDDEATTEEDIEAHDGVKYIPILKRSFVAGMYNTICVPFDSYDSELTSIFGAGYELLALESATLTDGVLVLNFQTVAGNSFAAGTPYLIKPTQDVVNPQFSKHTIHMYASNHVQHGGAADFIGTYIQKQLDADYDLFLGQNNILHFPSSTSAPLKGLRAYFHISAANAQAIKRARIVTQEQVITEIDLVNGENQGLIKTIENGQLIINLDGIRYNIMGGKIK